VIAVTPTARRAVASPRAGARSARREPATAANPARYDALWAHFIGRHGKQAGTRQMIGVLQLARTYGAAALQHTVDAALRLGCRDQAAVRHLLMTPTLERPPVAPIAIGALLAQYYRPLPSVAAYDTLMAQEAGR
jgi:hypothetical protein